MILRTMVVLCCLQVDSLLSFPCCDCPQVPCCLTGTRIRFRLINNHIDCFCSTKQTCPKIKELYLDENHTNTIFNTTPSKAQYTIPSIIIGVLISLMIIVCIGCFTLLQKINTHSDDMYTISQSETQNL